jgi:hypothetical protein
MDREQFDRAEEFLKLWAYVHPHLFANPSAGKLYRALRASPDEESRSPRAHGAVQMAFAIAGTEGPWERSWAAPDSDFDLAGQLEYLQFQPQLMPLGETVRWADQTLREIPILLPTEPEDAPLWEAVADTALREMLSQQLGNYVARTVDLEHGLGLRPESLRRIGTEFARQALMGEPVEPGVDRELHKETGGDDPHLFSDALTRFPTYVSPNIDPVTSLSQRFRDEGSRFAVVADLHSTKSSDRLELAAGDLAYTVITPPAGHSHSKLVALTTSMDSKGVREILGALTTERASVLAIGGERRSDHDADADPFRRPDDMQWLPPLAISAFGYQELISPDFSTSGLDNVPNPVASSREVVLGG